MTQGEAVKKYNIPPDQIWRMIDNAGVWPIGEVQGKVRPLKDYNEAEIVEAILAHFKTRYNKAMQEAEAIQKRAKIIKNIYKNSKTG